MMCRLFVLILSVILLGCSQKSSRYEGLSTSILELKQLQEDYGFPERLETENAKKTDSDLKLMEYFEIFHHLKMKDGYELDWVYSFDGLGGSPNLYARHTEQTPFKTHEELVEAVRREAELDAVEAVNKEYHEEFSKAYNMPSETLDEQEAQNKRTDEILERWDAELAKFPRREYWNWWREYVVTDGTDEGFLELAALFLLGDQFALYWHSNYNDLKIISDEDTLNVILETPYRYNGEILPDDVVKDARKLDPWPVVERNSGKVSVSVLTFSKWGGFERCTLVISESAPHQLFSEEKEGLVFFSCGIQY